MINCLYESTLKHILAQPKNKKDIHMKAVPYIIFLIIAHDIADVVHEV